MGRHCPDDEILMDYLEGRLSGRRRARVEGHLAGCSSCREQIRICAELIFGDGADEEIAVPAAVTRRAIQAVTGQSTRTRPADTRAFMARGMALIEKLTGGAALSPVPVRGPLSAESRHLIRRHKSFQDLEVIIEIEKRDVAEASIRVGVVTGKLPLRISLVQGRREVASLVCGLTPVLFDEIPFGAYSLIFVHDGRVIGEYPFEIIDSNGTSSPKE
ncbi:MAG: hypothetical protein C4519_11595 [Desulfobacteraceae bacterium]|nr:MAG: hypothetical protein C4519_11595 [Desulfobacteraceae bacterium]